MVSRVDLPPGRYELRFAVERPGQKDTGSVYADVEVPDFAKACAIHGETGLRGAGLQSRVAVSCQMTRD